MGETMQSVAIGVAGIAVIVALVAVVEGLGIDTIQAWFAELQP